MMIVFEGIDGVGKTTYAKKLSELLGLEYYKIPPPKYSRVRRIFNELSVDARYTFYLMLNTLTPSEGVIDRYVLTTVSYHEAMGFKGARKTAKMFLELGIIRKPSAVIYLKVEEQERRKRLAARGFDIYDTEFDLHREAKEIMEDLIREDFLGIGSDRYLILDTTRTSIEEGFKVIRAWVYKIILPEKRKNLKKPFFV